MTANNISHISSTQPDFSNLSENNQDPLCLPPVSIYPSPIPPAVHPTSPPSRISPPLPKPVTQTQHPPRDTMGYLDDIPSETAGIFDYMIWSRLNLFFGAIILGIPGIILSIITRRYKREGNVARAKILSSITLGINIFVSFLFMCGMIYLITRYNYSY